MRKEYASELTKDFLIKAGVVAVDLENCRVFGEQSEFIPVINKQDYLMISLYDLDENGNRIKIPIKRKFKGCKKPTNTYIYKNRIVSLNRLLWAWKYGSVPAGYVIDHINNKHTELEDYKLDNLQCITPAENLSKERPESTTMCRPAYGVSKEVYEQRLEYYLAEYEKAKKEHNAKAAHRLRSNIAAQKARIRYILKYGELN